MTNKDFFNAYCGEHVLYKGKDIGAYVAGYIEDKYIILGFNDYTGSIQCFTSKVKNLCAMYHSYRFAKLKYLTVAKLVLNFKYIKWKRKNLHLTSIKNSQ